MSFILNNAVVLSGGGNNFLHAASIDFSSSEFRNGYQFVCLCATELVSVQTCENGSPLHQWRFPTHISSLSFSSPLKKSLKMAWSGPIEGFDMCTFCYEPT